MNIGVVGKYLEDIKLILNISSLFKSNYFYCLNKDDESLNNIIDYLINNHNIDILIILTTKNINYIKKQYKNIFIINMTDVLFNYVKIW